MHTPIILPQNFQLKQAQAPRVIITPWINCYKNYHRGVASSKKFTPKKHLLTASTMKYWNIPRTSEDAMGLWVWQVYNLPWISLQPLNFPQKVPKNSRTAEKTSEKHHHHCYLPSVLPASFPLSSRTAEWGKAELGIFTTIAKYTQKQNSIFYFCFTFPSSSHLIPW